MSAQTPETPRLRGLMLVAGREIRVRGLAKANLISMAITVLIVGVLAALPAILSGGDDTTAIGIAGSESTAMQQQLEAIGDYDVTVYGSAAEAERAVQDEDVDAAVADGKLYSQDGVGNEEQTVLESVWQSAAVETSLTEAGLDAAQIQDALSVAPLESVTFEQAGGAENDPTAYFTGLIISILIFFMLMMPVQYIAMGVVEEKSSRIVEILLTSLKPWQLLGGKVIGLGVISAVNLIAIVAVGLGVSAATGMLPELPPGTTSAALSTLGWWVLAFALYGTLAGGIGSLVSRQEDAGSVLAPLTTTLTIAYVGSIFILNAPGSLFAEILSIVPPFSAIAMPTRIAIQEVPAWQVVLAVGLLAVAAAGALALGATLYKRSVLHTGSRLKLMEALRKAA
ncbi:ABC transporter permease [Glycomyces buryatensis]|uniref:ABC transporter permease n=1 Tax=Glycomyces buryatensis TaxID=2570927 RepID=A0A4S8QAJ8_9ACTN|nr:ABC transporter permease [Glycomyces buryatensis]THV41290.1 ABC transporter permease [Glycomyces buryatensis]